MRNEIAKEFLEETYTRQKLSTWAIEKKFGISRSRIYTRLKYYRIPIRSIAQSHIRYKRTTFSGDLREKAYLLGFAIGDLRVRRHNGGKSETISIACGSTKRAQITLIEKLFSPYGRVWIGKPSRRGVMNIEAFVDFSFDFLLPNKRNYDWVFRKRDHFLSFLGGFTDAEGSIFISRNMATFAIGNYKKDILWKIYKQLRRMNIEVRSVVCDSLAGYKGRDGYRRKSNYCHLSCSRKKSLGMLLHMLRPFLKHSDRKAALQKALANLASRNKKH